MKKTRLIYTVAVVAALVPLAVPLSADEEQGSTWIKGKLRVGPDLTGETEDPQNDGTDSVAMGRTSKAPASSSFAIGRETENISWGSVVLGYKNQPLGSYPGQWNIDDPVLVIGNGDPAGAKSNAMVILKGGNVGIGTNTPDYKLEVAGTGRFGSDLTAGNGKLITRSGTPHVEWQESDQTAPNGLWRARAVGSSWMLSRNTAAAGDFTSVVNDIQINSAGNVTIPGTLTLGGHLMPVPNTILTQSAANTQFLEDNGGGQVVLGSYPVPDSTAALLVGTGTSTSNTNTTLSLSKSGNMRMLGANSNISGGNASTTAPGNRSIQFGAGAQASGIDSFAFGDQVEASNNYSVALNASTVASGLRSLAVGYLSTASGSVSFAAGKGTLANSFAMTALGQYNKVGTMRNLTAWDDDDPVFVVGIGDSETTRDDAMVVLKGGGVGIGTNTPTHKLHVNGTAKVESTLTAGSLVVPGSLTLGGQTMHLPNTILTKTEANAQFLEDNGGGQVVLGSFPVADSTAALLVGNGSSSGSTVTTLSLSKSGNMRMFGANTNISGGNASTTTGPGNRSIQFGAGAKASGIDSFAFGDQVEASEVSSVALNQDTKASGPRSFAFGYESVASASNSAAGGRGTIADSFCMVAIGRWNKSGSLRSPAGWVESDPLFVVGNGDGETQAERKDAFLIRKSGDVEIKGNLDVSGDISVPPKGGISMGEFTAQ